MDIIDQAKERDELYRQSSLYNHFAGRSPSPRPSPFQGEGVTKRDCEDCGVPIPIKRLRANPGATRCIDCQVLAERRGFEDE